MEMVIRWIIYEFDKTDWATLQDGVKEMVELYAEFADMELIPIIENAIINNSYNDDEIANALRDAGLLILVYYEYMIWKIENNTNKLIVKFYAQQAIHKVVKFKGQLNQDLLPGFENI